MIAYEELKFLNEIFNGLSMITVKGQNAILMGKCLSSLEQFLTVKQQEFIQLNNTMQQSTAIEQTKQISNDKEE